MIRRIFARLLDFILGRKRPEHIGVVSDPVPQTIDPVPVVAPLPVEDQSPPGSDLHREKAFSHTKTRVFERYGFSLSRDMWNRWNQLIAQQDSRVLQLGHGLREDTLWRVSFGPVDVYVVYRYGFVLTALPPSDPRLPGFVREALEKRRIAKPPVRLKDGKVSSRTVGHGNLAGQKHRIPKPVKVVEKPKAVLPPKHLRPVRNEAYLRRLKLEALKKPVD
jgi:hypothetical protein